jgi:hypothetical protein
MSDKSSSTAPAGNIRVYVRVRPLSAREVESGGAGGSGGCLTALPSSRSIAFHGKPEKVFTFDHVAAAAATQDDVFQKVGKPITESCLAGYNGTIFCYGQTGSGYVAIAHGTAHSGAAVEPCFAHDIRAAHSFVSALWRSLSCLLPLPAKPSRSKVRLWTLPPVPKVVV